MLIRLNHLIRQQHGSSVVLVSVAFLTLLSIIGLVVDMGTLYNVKSHLQKTANASVLSGAQELINGDDKVSFVVHEVLTKHGEESSFVSMDVVPEHKVTVYLQSYIPMKFVGLFGFDNILIEVKAAAEILPMVSATGAAPLGIDESIDLVYNTPYSLKVDETESDTGNFGVLALGGDGAATYEQNLKNGYTNQITINDVIDTQTGNVTGKTKDGVKEKIESCPYPVGEIHHRDCPRILLVPVYRPYHYDQNQLKQIKIVGFSYFYITDPVDNFDKSIKGMFIKRAGTGFVSTGTADTGAYGIKLTD